MSIEVSSEGFLTDLWAINNENRRVFPHLKSKQHSTVKGFEITLTGRKEDYHLVNIEQFLDHIAKGDFDKVGRVKMKPKYGGQSNGFAVRKATMNTALLAEVEKRKSHKKTVSPNNIQPNFNHA